MVPWEPTLPSFLGVIKPIYWGFKTFIFHGFGVQGLGDFEDNAHENYCVSRVYEDPLMNETMTFDGMYLVFVLLKSSLSGSCHLIGI